MEGKQGTNTKPTPLPLGPDKGSTTVLFFEKSAPSPVEVCNMLLHDCENANFAYGKLYNLLTTSQRSRLLKIGGAVWEARALVWRKYL